MKTGSSRLRIKVDIEVDYGEFIKFFGYVPHDNHTKMLKEWLDHSLTEYDSYDGRPLETLPYTCYEMKSAEVKNE